MIDEEKTLREAYVWHRAAMASLQSHLDAIDRGSAMGGRKTFELIAALEAAHRHFMKVAGCITGVMPSTASQPK